MANIFPIEVLFEIFKYLYDIDPVILCDYDVSFLKAIGLYRFITENTPLYCGKIIYENSEYLRLSTIGTVNIGSNRGQQNIKCNFTAVTIPKRTLDVVFCLQQLWEKYCDIFNYIPGSLKWILAGDSILRALYQQDLCRGQIAIYVYGQRDILDYLVFYDQFLRNLETKFQVKSVKITAGVRAVVLDLNIILYVIFTADIAPEYVMRLMPFDSQQMYIEHTNNNYDILLSKSAIRSIQRNQSQYLQIQTIAPHETEQAVAILQCGMRIATISPIYMIGNCCGLIGNDKQINLNNRECDCIYDKYHSQSKHIYSPPIAPNIRNIILLQGLILFDISASDNLRISTLQFIIPQKHHHYKHILITAELYQQPPDSHIVFQICKGFIILYILCYSSGDFQEQNKYDVVLRPVIYTKDDGKLSRLIFDKKYTLRMSQL